jgi:hypothetical protein
MWGRRLENLNQWERIAKIAINAKIAKIGSLDRRSLSQAKDEVCLCSNSQSQNGSLADC